MIGRTLLRVCFAALGLGIAGTADAADYDGQLPGEGFNGMFNCLYARVDGGVSLFARPDVIQPIGAGFSNGNGGTLTTAINAGIDPAGFFEGGVGCQVADSMRIEITGGLRLKSALDDAFPASLDANISSQNVFVSTYWDITNYGGFTPYVGGGIGAARHDLSDISAPLGAADAAEYDFAYHVTVGFSYDLTQNMKFDLAYRYVDLGEVVSGIDLNAAAADQGAIGVSNIEAHEVKVGLRYSFGKSGW